MRLILASASPRRRQLLKELLPHFEVEPSLFEEKNTGLSAEETVLSFAEGKAREVQSRFSDAAVLGADTVVCLDGVIFGKPKDREDAFRMLSLLSGRVHEVYTGVCVKSAGKELSTVVTTKVRFLPLTEGDIETYIGKYNPLDKAGAYGIQDGGVVASVEGSYSNVVGLPLEETRALLTAHGGILC